VPSLLLNSHLCQPFSVFDFTTHQLFFFSQVHSVRAADDPSLSLAIASSTSSSAHSFLDPVSGSLLPSVTNCIDTWLLRQELKAIDKREVENEDEGEGEGEGGGTNSNPIPSHHFGLSSSWSSSSSSSSSSGGTRGRGSLPPVSPTTVHIPIFLLSLNHATLLDCDATSARENKAAAELSFSSSHSYSSAFSHSSSSPHASTSNDEELTSSNDAFLEARAVGPTSTSSSNSGSSSGASTTKKSWSRKRKQHQQHSFERPLDMLIAVQSPATHEPVKGERNKS
jgi:hypothetical protein